MAKNADLSNAKNAKKDEFYTQLEDINAEMVHYENQFKGKTILMNCDDPTWSNFWRYFHIEFERLGLKKIIATHYEYGDTSSYKMEYTGGNDADTEDGVKTDLISNGDFRSPECIELLKEADIIVTNPPFSLFREYIALLMEYDKKFIIIGNVNALTYKEVFPLIKDNKVWFGASIHSGDRKFYVPDDYPLNASTCGVDEDGRKFIRVKGVRWFTNIDYPMRHEELDLYRKYYGHEEDYPKYDNYDAINVDKTSEIPCDYFEDIGVPITFLDKYNPEQFDVVKFRKGDDGKDLTYTVETDTIATDRQTDRQTDRRLLHTSESSSDARRCNGIMGVPITFLDKFNPDQFEIVGNEYTLGIEKGRGYINGKRMYSRLFIKLKQKM